MLITNDMQCHHRTQLSTTANRSQWGASQEISGELGNLRLGSWDQRNLNLFSDAKSASHRDRVIKMPDERLGNKEESNSC